jgi:RimJ/RimL family protein N-acetyltransferase
MRGLKMRPVILRGSKIYLSVTLEQDKEKWLVWINDRDIQNFISSPMDIYFEKDFDEILEELRRKKSRTINFAIVENNKDRLVGFIWMDSIDWQARNAKIMYFIGKEHWGKGYASEALSLICEFAFENMNLEKVYTFVHETNGASLSVLEKNRFTLVGRLRRHAYVPKYGYVDVLVYELLKEEWKKPSINNLKIVEIEVNNKKW